MTDRELLEAAAKAAGIVNFHHATSDGRDYLWRNDQRWGSEVWAPLIDDGDALRLAVKLGMAVSVEFNFASTAVLWGPPTGNVREPHGDDPCAATRRAIVRAAAAMAVG